MRLQIFLSQISDYQQSMSLRSLLHTPSLLVVADLRNVKSAEIMMKE